MGEALSKKNDYTAATLLLAQIEVAAGNASRAIASLEAGSRASPNNALVFFQLGFLHYSERNNAAAITALERAVALDANFSNARYFLGLSYARLGRIADATAQFERITELNPDNAEIQNILANLRAGKSPLSTPRTGLERPPFDE